MDQDRSSSAAVERCPFAAHREHLYGHAGLSRERKRVADDIFSQAQSELRAQQMRAMARRYAATAIGLAVVVGAGIGIWQWRVHDRLQVEAAASSRYFEAVHRLEAAGPGGSSKGLTTAQRDAETVFADLAVHASSDIRDYAGLRLAALRLADHDAAGAQHAWSAIAHDADADPDLRALARLLGLNASMETADPATLRAGYADLASSAGPWRALAQEGLIALDLRPDANAAQQAEARRLLTHLSTAADAPDGARQRANALLQTYGGAG